MHNPTVMAVRTFVLLGCLIALPLFAIFGKSAPDTVAAWLRKLTGGANQTASPIAASGESPVFRPGLTAQTTSAAPQAIALAGQQPLSGDPHQAPQPIPVAGPPGPSRTQAQQSANWPNAVPPRNHGAADQRASLASHEQEQPAPSLSPINGVEGAAPVERRSSRFPQDYFRNAEQRLRELGATYYLLETLGPDGGQYRFVCKVAVAQNREPVAFFATENDPLAAMNNVIYQLEGWRSRLGPAPN